MRAMGRHEGEQACAPACIVCAQTSCATSLRSVASQHNTLRASHNPISPLSLEAHLQRCAGLARCRLERRFCAAPAVRQQRSVHRCRQLVAVRRQQDVTCRRWAGRWIDGLLVGQSGPRGLVGSMRKQRGPWPSARQPTTVVSVRPPNERACGPCAGVVIGQQRGGVL